MNLLAVVRNTFMGPLTQIHQVAEPSTLLFLPLAHVFARIIEVGCLEAGIVLGHCEDMAGLLPDLGSFKPTFVLAVPRVFEKVYNGAEQRAIGDGRGRIFARAARIAVAYSRATDAPGGPGLGLRIEHALYDRLVYGKMRAALGGRAQYVVSGGAALAERLGHFFRGAGITILEGYGLTETTAPVSVNRPDRQKIGSVGQPLPGVAVRIADDGEVLVKGKSIFPGYWQNQQATAETFTSDGWFRSGDLGVIDTDGRLRIVGRLKEMINRGGKKFFPREIEEILYTHPQVLYAAIVGIPDPRLGERNCLCLVPRAGEAPTLEGLIAFIGDGVATYKLPERLELFTQFPFTPTGKIQRHALVRDVVTRISATS
jgi:long-chain acyl-CoA synthetase